MEIDVNAKLNLGLKVLNKVEDKHNLDMLCHSIDLCDSFSLVGGEGVEIEDETLNLDKDKYMAFIQSVLNDFNLSLKVKVIKRIPLGGGLGGGTTFYVALLTYLEEKKKIFSNEEMLKVASDLPFMYEGGFKRIEGYGLIKENLEPLNLYVLLLTSGSVSTRDAFMLCDKMGREDIDIDSILYSLKNFKDIHIKNDLYKSAKMLNSEISNIENFLVKYDLPFFMTGAGSTMVVLSRDKESLQKILNDFTSSCSSFKKTFTKIARFVKSGKIIKKMFKNWNI